MARHRFPIQTQMKLAIHKLSIIIITFSVVSWAGIEFDIHLWFSEMDVATVNGQLNGTHVN